MKWIIAISILAVCAFVKGQVISGNGVLSDTGTLQVFDYCTFPQDGQTNPVTGGDQNFKTWFASRIDTSASYDSCHFTQVLTRNGTPTASVSIALFADNAGQPGALLVETPPLLPTQITSGFATNIFTASNPWPMTNGTTLFIAVHFSDAVVLGVTTNYYTVHNVFSGLAADKMWLSDDGVNWVFGGGLAFLAAQIRRPE